MAQYLPPEQLDIALAEALSAYCSLEDRISFRILDLPGELRNLIYGYASEGMVLAQNPFDPALPCLCRYLMIDRKLLEYDARPHPLLQICRQIRAAFAHFLTTSPSIHNRRAAVVHDFDFDPLIKHLRRYPPLASPCQLEVHLRFTERVTESLNSLQRFLNACTAPAGSEILDDDVPHIIHNDLYYLKFVADPRFSFQQKKRIGDLLCQHAIEAVEIFDDSWLKDEVIRTRMMDGLGMCELTFFEWWGKQ